MQSADVCSGKQACQVGVAYNRKNAESMHLHPGRDCPDWCGQQHIAATCKESHKQGASNANVLRLGLLLCLQASHSNLPKSGIQVEVHSLTDCCP